MPPHETKHPVDLAGREFWDALWRSKTDVTREIGQPRLKNWEIQYAEFFERAFANIETNGERELLEIGAGDSGWLAYFAKRWSFRVSGLDYSPVGCSRAAELLRRAGVPGEIVLGDMFAPPAELLGRFHAVVSAGVAEHYEDTGHTIGAMAQFLRPGGVIITTVPNIAGLVGDIFKILNRPVFDVHEAVDAHRLRNAHESAGLEIVESGHLMSVNLAIPNVAGLPPGLITTLKKLVVLAFIASSRAVWWMEERFRRLPAHPYLSPYVYVIARKPLG